MFDKMIVSDANSVESKSRSRYFLVSTTVVGILFITAVVFSLYAADIGLGNDEFEISMMLAPVTPDQPEPPRPEPERAQSQPQQADEPSRVHNIPRLDEHPISVPDQPSVTPSQFLSRPIGRFKPGPVDTGIGASGDAGPARGGDNSTGTGSSSEPGSGPVAETVKVPPPPPVIKPKRPVPTVPISIGVANGHATHLPKPPYPAAAIAVRVEGEVTVQVTIDETGKVVSARVAKGHPLLRAAAEKAAWGARFTPTKLSNVPVKVTGVIVYNFKRS